MNKLFIVWTGLKSKATYYYTDKHVTLMTEDFSKASIFDTEQDFWELASNPKVGRFKVHQAPEKDVFKWQLKNKVPNERL